MGWRLGSRDWLAYLAPMRVLAIVTMMFAWLAYGTLSAWAGCAMCASADMASNAQQHHMASMDTAGMAADTRNVANDAAPAKDPCANGGMAHMPFCSACLVMPPAVAMHADEPRLFSYPSPAPSAAFPGARPAPLAPPPRSV